MSLGDQIAFWGVWTAITSAVIGYVSYRVSKAAARLTKESQRNELFLSLRSRYLSIRLKIPDRVYQTDFSIHTSDDSWIHIEQYWYNAFDEWYSTNKLNDGHFIDLWNSYFGPAVQFSLCYPAMVVVLDSMLDGRVSFGGERDEFKHILMNLYRELDVSERAKSDVLGLEPGAG